MDRRRHLKDLAVLGLLACVGEHACRRAPSRESVLRDLVEQLVVSDTRAVSRESRALSAALSKLAGAPSAEALNRARTHWKRAAIAWKRAYGFRLGPMVSSNAFLSGLFWPCRTAAVAAVIAESSRIDGGRIEELGADAKGMFALEYLLFGDAEATDSVRARFMGAPGERTRLLADELGKNLTALSARAEAELGDGKALATMFAADSQRSVNRIVNQMVENVEGVFTNRVRLVIDASTHLEHQDVEGGFSGTSSELARTLIATTEKLFVGISGGGLDALVANVSPAVRSRVVTAFQDANRALERVPGPLEQVARSNAGLLESAASKLKSLELAIKVDLASALGVTLTFATGDGD